MDKFTLNDLSKALQPKGNKPVVHLTFINPFFDHMHIQKCIAQLRIKTLMGDHNLNPLEQIGVIALFDSAGIEIPYKK